MERREFLGDVLSKVGAAAAVAALPGLTDRASASPAVKPGGKGHVLLSISGKDPGTSILRFYDWDAKKVLEDHVVPLENPHSMILDRHDASTTYLFESFGSALKYNLKTGAATKIDHRVQGGFFAGHGVQTVSGEKLLCTESGKGGRSKVSLRSSKDLKVIGEAPDECGSSHQIIHLPGSRMIACGNMAPVAGQKQGGGITFFDYETGKIAGQVALDYPILHLIPLSSTETLGCSVISHKNPGDRLKPLEHSSLETTHQIPGRFTYSAGPLCYARIDGTKKFFWDESQSDLFLFNFGVALLPGTDSFVSTHLISNKVLLWKDGKIAYRWDVKTPNNILASKDGREFMVKVGDSEIRVFDTETRKESGKIMESGRKVLTLASY